MDSVSNLNAIRTIFPDFVDRVVCREIEKSNMKCTLQSCQRTTTLFIEQGVTKSSEEIFNLLNLEKTDAYLNEAREYNKKIREFASQFLDINLREAQLNLREAQLKIREAKLEAREAVISKNIFIKIYRKLKRYKYFM